jgi:hypothetical protein
MGESNPDTRYYFGLVLTNATAYSDSGYFTT